MKNLSKSSACFQTDPLHPWQWPLKWGSCVHTNCTQKNTSLFLIINDVFFSRSSWHQRQLREQLKNFETSFSFTDFAKYQWVTKYYSYRQESSLTFGPPTVWYTFTPFLTMPSNEAAEQTVQKVKRALLMHILENNASSQQTSLQNNIDSFLMTYHSPPSRMNSWAAAGLIFKVYAKGGGGECRGATVPM